ncbi:hypothetical protein ABTK39_19715, partial [Acinetobacter baumannii]
MLALLASELAVLTDSGAPKHGAETPCDSDQGDRDPEARIGEQVCIHSLMVHLVIPSSKRTPAVVLPVAGGGVRFCALL